MKEHVSLSCESCPVKAKTKIQKSVLYIVQYHTQLSIVTEQPLRSSSIYTIQSTNLKPTPRSALAWTTFYVHRHRGRWPEP